MGNRRYQNTQTLPPDTYEALSYLSKRSGARRVFQYIKTHATQKRPVTITRISNGLVDIERPDVNLYLTLFDEYGVARLGTMQVEYGWNTTATGKIIEKRVMWIPAVYKINSLAVREFSKMVAKKHHKRTK